MCSNPPPYTYPINPNLTFNPLHPPHPCQQVCGHLWANDFYKDAILPNGVCYTAASSLSFHTVTKQRPCVSGKLLMSSSSAWIDWLINLLFD